jgi:hypothetical protein
MKSGEPTWSDGDGDGQRRGATGELIAGRYRMGRRLGGGAHGQVFEAVDLGTGAEVAIKVFEPDCDPARIRREIGVLRLLRVPGVVALLDEGCQGEAPFLVMERILGSPFPGAAAPMPWEALAPRAIAFLEVLAGVHPAGIIHRDLKPANVLVDRDGAPTVVDFGISSAAGMARSLTREGQILGTPAYLAPEQIRGESSGPATDLYAVGVMLYEALTGRSPHNATSLPALFYDRLHRVPRSVASWIPDVPAHVARVVDQLLAIEPVDRPRSADAVLSLLAAQATPSLAVPWLGSRLPADDVVDALRAGSSIVIAGPRGCGRSRVLRDAHDRWVASGRGARWTTPGSLPYESLEPVVGELIALQDAPLDRVDGEVARRFAALRHDGLAIFADDVETCDVRTQALLEREAAHGMVVRGVLASDPARAHSAVFLADLQLGDLVPLFAGPERLFHRCSDAARTLHSFTGGRPARIATELLRWTRQGVASWVGSQLAVDRARLDELDARPAILVSPASAGEVPVPPGLIDLLAWLIVAGPGVDIGVLARATGWRRYQLEGRLEELEGLGLIQRSADRVVPLNRLLDAVPWGAEEVRVAHRALAASLAPASPRRLFHLLAGQEPDAPVATDEITAETLALARREVVEGRVTRAATWLVDGLAAVRRGPRSSADRTLLAEFVRVALLAATSGALDTALAEIARSRCRRDEVADLDVLARAALASLTADGERALSLIDAVPPFPDGALELERQAARVRAARRGDLEGERRVVESAARWAEERGDGEARARASSWLGALRFRERQFGEAARLHHLTALGTELAVVRVTAWLDAADAEVWDLRCDEAARDAERARAEAERYRFVFHEGQAEWLLRYAAYRNETTSVCDDELVGLSALVGVPALEAQICLTEGAVAWRGGDVSKAARLAGRAADLWRSLSLHTPAATAMSLVAACRHALDDDGWRHLCDVAAAAWDPWIGMQIAGLVCVAAPSRVAATAPLLVALASKCPPRDWGARLDVLSPRECFAAAGLPVPAQRQLHLPIDDNYTSPSQAPPERTG